MRAHQSARERVEVIDEIVNTSRSLIVEAEANREQAVAAFTQAEAVNMLSEAFTEEVLTSVMALQGKRTGFVVDKHYPAPVVREAVIEALSLGYRLTGNEWNIIAGNFYPAKNGVRNRILETEGVSHLEVDIGVPEGNGKGMWAIPCRGSYCYRGEIVTVDRTKSDAGDFRIVLPMYKTDKPAVVQGKAESRMYRLLHQRLTGTNIDVAEDLDDNVIEGEIVQAVGREDESDGGEQPTAVQTTTDRDGSDSSSSSWLIDQFVEKKSVGECNALAASMLEDDTLGKDEREEIVAVRDARIAAIRRDREQRMEGNK